MKNISAILFLFLSVSISQESDAAIVEESNDKMGIGFEFHTFPTTMLTAQNNGVNGLSLFFPILISEFFVEPEVSYWSYTEKYDDSGSDAEHTISNLRMVVGLFHNTTKVKSSQYLGVRIGYNLEKEVLYIDDDEDDEEFEYKLFIVAPTIGAQYFISKNFSIGGEFSAVRASHTDSDDDEIEQITWTTVPRLILRFYF
tara:strand:+ start:1180 stop:1776 length:597 start_codon:yes stop_codon:yes gene_type:complete